MLKYALISVTLIVTLVAVTYCQELPTVEQQRVGYSQDNYKRPVREGNCWRQFTATDSILVCH